ncbi:hypothetical protein chiPu_0016601 [Chiloscyllium punctatum]|uniref:SPIN-DOC-like zinc-finger domain-containing protein n=1 Tax=Chiloscyllium punctatum TaxID=137246 RepID=A0A401T638_CHIPU|nr:hypothetical protein [Chiloscyllium punctatum]
MCLVCGAQVTVFKDYNLNHHYVTKLAEKYNNLSDQERARELDALLAKLHNQQRRFTKLHISRDAAVKTSYVITHKIARNSKPFSDGEFIKERLLDSAELICPEKKEAFENVSLSRPTVTRRIGDIARNLELQLQHRAVNFDFFSLALEESCDVRDTAQLLIFVRGITTDFKITEELAAMKSIKGTTTGNDLFTEEVLCKSVLKINHVVDVVTKIVNFMKARALNHRQFAALLEENDTEHRDIGYHTAVRWLSLGKMLESVWDLREETQDFCVKKGNGIPQLSDADWIADLGFAVDVTALMNELNLKLQCKGLFGHELYNLVKAFMRKLQLLSSQMEVNILTHLPTLKEYLQLVLTGTQLC